MQKTLVVALREYQAAVRTKAFVIGLLFMPLIMGGSVGVQVLFKDVVDTSDKHFGIVNRTASQEIVKAFERELHKRNEKTIFDSNDKQVKPRFLIESVPPSGSTEEAVGRQRAELSKRVRKGDWVGFLEFLPPRPGTASDGDKKPVLPSPAQIVLHYETDRPTYTDFSQFAQSVMTDFFRGRIAKEAALSDIQAKAMVNPVMLESKGLTAFDEKTGKVEAAKEQNRAASFILPLMLMMLMFMIILSCATPLMQGVVEEKMQRIAEVLLGSVRPFELMMGKLIGMTGVSLTIASVYLAGALWGLNEFGLAEYISPNLVVWFVIYQALAALMYGSLFIAVGAACTEMKETQNLMWPVMLLACFPLFLMGNVIRDPNSMISRGVSFFPFATPTMMIARQAVPPGIPTWEPAVGVVLVLVTTVLCVYVASRIFRVGILMQGKGARLGEIIKWVVRG